MGDIAYIKIFLDWIEATKRLKDAEKGRLVDALVAYARGDKDADGYLTGNEIYLFPTFKLAIDRDKATHTVHSENGSKGGAPRGNQNAKKQPKTTKNNQKQADKDKDKDKDKDDIPPLPPMQFDSVEMQSAFDDWLAYKAERRETYKPKGKQALVTRLQNEIAERGESAVIEGIRYSMSQGWKGIFYPDKGKTTTKRVNDELAEWMNEVTI